MRFGHKFCLMTNLFWLVVFLIQFYLKILFQFLPFVAAQHHPLFGIFRHTQLLLYQPELSILSIRCKAKQLHKVLLHRCYCSSAQPCLSRWLRRAKHKVWIHCFRLRNCFRSPRVCHYSHPKLSFYPLPIARQLCGVRNTNFRPICAPCACIVCRVVFSFLPSFCV